MTNISKNRAKAKTELLNPSFDTSVLTDNKIKSHVEGLKNKKGNPFPIDVFPRAVQDIINATYSDLNFPVDFTGVSMLYAASVAIGNTHRVEVMKGYQQSAMLYIAITGRKGTCKSHPLKFAIKPLLEKDEETFNQYEIDKKEYDMIMGFSKQELAQSGLDEPVKPSWRKFLLTDFTPEALVGVHKFNKKGIGVYADEMASWFKNFNRYNKGSEMEFWLSAWSGSSINIDRKTSDPILIPLPFISVIGTIQNELLDELAKGNRVDNGFIDRILFAIPDNLKKHYWSETELNPIVFENWKNIISRLINIPIKEEGSKVIPQVLRYTEEARKLIFKWQRTNTDESNKPENEAISGMYSKLEMYAIRFSLILEMMSLACGQSDGEAIGIESVKGAIKLIDYFKASAIKVNAIISNSSSLDKLPKNKQNFYEALPEIVKTKDAIKLASKFNIQNKTAKRFLGNKSLFLRIRHGEYEKLL